MSDRYELPLPVQPEWQSQYSYLPQQETSGLTGPVGDSRRTSLAKDNGVKKASEPPEGHRCTGDLLTPKSVRHSSSGEDQPSFADKGPEFPRVPPLPAVSQPLRQTGPNNFHTVLAAEAGPAPATSHYGLDSRDSMAVEEADLDEDDDDAAGPDGDGLDRPQTAAERLAARRKMKRFRLTHQQTRFLMSEFAKQPHPDAAHRERLSREIPGLSPRQVQVCRAKIKRLTADDRDRMIRMRAVPDDFDNVQALHSPYGAVHGMGPTSTPPKPLNPSSYGNHMLRPLMVDVRRNDDVYLSPTGLTPSFGGVDIGQPGSGGSADLVSPLSTTSSDRFGPPGHMPVPRLSNPQLGQHGSMEGVGHVGRPNLRLLPLTTRDSIPRSATDSIQSPRTNLSWKSDSVDYSVYPGGPPERQGTYQPGQAGSAPPSAMGGLDSQPYTGGSSMSSSSGPGYLGLGQSAQTQARARASSTSLTIDFGFRDAYRPTAPSSPPYSSRGPSTSQDGPPASSTGYPPAPLSAPLSVSPRRFHGRVGLPEYTDSQLSAPITAPSDFGRSFHGEGSVHPPTPSMKDYFGSGSVGYSQG
ncbi:homeobox domain-containing protein [Purpureocillium lilacinum]|uniref:Homeobox domain-containing protein n=1 Tax=Purpureocillium lilacinum TaxID=33203 RepID=A0A179GHT9_PURLI|nr:homeobox domain-containing protein [Purpureocillium lilacinum]